MKLVKKILLLVILIFSCSFTNFESFFDLSAKELANQQLKWLAIDSIFAMIIILLVYFIYKRVKKETTEITLKNKILFTLGFVILAVGINYLYGFLVNTTSNQELVNEVATKAPILAAFQVRLFAPIVEEFIFRGIFMNLFFVNDTKLSRLMRVFVSGLIFGVAHTFSFSLELLLYSIMGWLLSSVYYFTKDIRCPIIVHLALNNI